MNSLSDEKIIESWKKNINPWITAIRNGEIDSRVQTTNKAILEAVLRTSPKSVLDIGCGEGWLVRELAKSGIDILGIDVVPELISSAIKEGAGRYKVLAYEEISYEVLKEKYDVVVSNFSLLGNESVTNIFRKVPSILADSGYFIVQTMHPSMGSGDAGYEDGWRKGTWDGFNKTFTDPAPWYFRTLDSWMALFEENRFTLEKIEEPMSERTVTAASIVFIGKIEN